MIAYICKLNIEPTKCDGVPTHENQKFPMYWIALDIINFISPLAVSWIPVIAELATLSSLFISLLLSSSVALVVVAVAWIHYRPIYATAVLIGAFVPFLIPKLFTPKQRMTD